MDNLESLTQDKRATSYKVAYALCQEIWQNQYNASLGEKATDDVAIIY